MRRIPLLLVLVLAGPGRAQVPDTFTDLEVLSPGISKDELIEVMREFSFALDVGCSHCHVQKGEGFRSIDFAADHPAKETARRMMRMTAAISRRWLADLEARAEPPVEISCQTCHRGQALPRLLSQELRLAAEAAGADSAVARYRQLRATAYGGGAYDFGEWETSRVAQELADAGRTEAAIALYELNAEYHPESGEIAAGLGRLYAAEGDVHRAVEALERAVALGNESRRVRALLQQLRLAVREEATQ